MTYDTIILGAGAAGMMCAAHADGRVLLVDHAKAAGEKIRISGGGRCNFTNLHCAPEAFLSQNPHFAKSALARYTQWDFIDLIGQHGIAWHEKTLGQLFCDNSAKDIIAMLHRLMQAAGVELRLQTRIAKVVEGRGGYKVTLEQNGQTSLVEARNLVIATGGKSIPKMGATGFAYQIAEQFDLEVVETRAGLVPFTFADQRFAKISGVSLPGYVSTGATGFEEAVLFTHRGLSGPAILQASSYWAEGAEISFNLLPKVALFETLQKQRQQAGRKNITTYLSQHLPARLVDHLKSEMTLEGNLADYSDAKLQSLCDTLHAWTLRPSGTEGYRTAEVTVGGVDTQALSSKTMMAKQVQGLYFIGEAVDVTGWLGGYNFQWAWSSAMAAAAAIKG